MRGGNEYGAMHKACITHTKINIAFREHASESSHFIEIREIYEGRGSEPSWVSMEWVRVQG